MLGKLIKNDFKASAHSMLGLYVIAILVGILTALSYAFDKLVVFQAIGTFILIMLSFAIMIITVFVMLSYFNKSLYSNQGYLSYTIPVKSRDLLFSKALVSFSWVTLSYVLYIGIYAFIIKFFFSKIEPEVLEELNMLYEMIEKLPDKSILVKVIVALVLILFMEVLVLISQIFFSMTLSNIKPFNQFGTAGGVLLFIGVFAVMFGIFISLTRNLPVALYFADSKVSFTTNSMSGAVGEGTIIGIGGFIFQIISTAVMFIGTNYLMKKKINIK